MRGFLFFALGCSPVAERLEPLPRAPRAATESPVVGAEAREWFLRAEIAELRADFDEADRAWGWVLRHAPEEPSSWVAWGRYLVRQRRDKEAEEAFREALQRDGSWPPAHLLLGDLLVRREQFEVAATHLERAVRAGEIEGYEVLDRLYERMDRMSERRELLERWLLESNLQVADRATRAAAAVAVGHPGAAIDDLLAVISERDDPLAGELLVEAAQQACRVEEVQEALGRLGVLEDARYAVSNARLAALLAAPDPSCHAAAEEETRR